jgi:CheY-like chemotaxis protein
MPVLDGLAAAALILAQPAPPPIIALTAAATDEVRQKCAESGMIDFMAKPVSPEALNEALRPFLQPQR